jgi:hypothetical protein
LSIPTKPQSIIHRFGDPDLSSKQLKKNIDACNQMVQSRMNDGWDAYFVTFMFRPLSGSHSSIVIRMNHAIEQYYATFLTRVVRRPLSKCEKPILIAMADFPVRKRKNKSSISDVKINDGLHFHAILLIPPKSRLKTSVKEHFRENEAMYLKNRQLIDRIDIESIVTKSPDRVTDYMFKSLKRGLSYDRHILILPKASSECRGRIFLTETTPGRLKERQ